MYDTSFSAILTIANSKCYTCYGGCNPPSPFQISKIKESNKTKQKIEDNLLDKEEDWKSCIFV